jgi:hypothetical protein
MALQLKRDPERKRRLSDNHEKQQERNARRMQALQEIWAQIPSHQLGKKMTKREREEILGIGPNGY